MKNLNFIIIGISMLITFSCTKETGSGNGQDSRMLGIVVNKAVEREDVTKSAEEDTGGSPYMFEVGDDTLYITESVSQMEDPMPSETGSGSSLYDAGTKGSVIEAVGDKFNQFTLSILKLDGSGFYMDVVGTFGTQVVNYIDGEWTTNQIWWPVDKDEKLLFFAYNAKTTDRFVNKYTFHKNLDFSLHYVDNGGTAGKSAEEEKDILYAVNMLSRSQGIKRAHDTAIGLQFHHLLAGLKFNFGQITSGLTLTNVTIEGLKTDLTCYYKFSDQSITWAPTDTATSRTLSQDFDMATASNTSCDDTAGTRTFFIAPQDIPEDATITYTLKSTALNQTIKRTFNLKDVLTSQTKWEAGKLYTYTISANVIFAELDCNSFKSAASKKFYYIKTIRFSVNDKTGTEGTQVQSSRSLAPIYATFDSESGEFVIHTAAPKIFFPEICDEMFGFTMGTGHSYGYYGDAALRALTSIKNLTSVDTRNVISMECMFYGCSSLTSLDISNFNTANVLNMDGMFANCSKLTSLDVSNFDTAQTKKMNGMFCRCSGLTSLNVTNFNTTNVNDMSFMFTGCSGLTSLDVTKFNTANVVDMYSMFSGCSSLTSLDVSNFNTSKVTDMVSMFYNCSAFTSLNVSNFNTSNVTGMSYMFSGCSGLTSLDVSNFDTSKVAYMSSMFSGCSALTSLDLLNFDTSNVTIMDAMFSSCSALTSLDLSNFNTSNVTGPSYKGFGMNYMLRSCRSLETLTLGKDFTVASSKSDMLDGTFSDISAANVSITCTQAAKDALISGTTIRSDYDSFSWTILE